VAWLSVQRQRDTSYRGLCKGAAEQRAAAPAAHLNSLRARRCTHTTPVSHSASMMALYTMASALQPWAFMRSYAWAGRGESSAAVVGEQQCWEAR